MNVPNIPGFEILELTRESSTSRTWKAMQHSLERVVLVRTLNDGVSEHHRESFETIARAVAQIKHPGLIQVFDVARCADGGSYLVLEAVEGTILADLLQQRTRLAPALAARIAAEVADMLAAAWTQVRLVHRNLKPENLCITAEGGVKITEFSTATLIRPDVDPLEHDEGMIVGTPNYMAPEQAQGHHDLDFHADMYGLGALLYHLLTGVAPFAYDPDPVHVMQLQMSASLPSPRVANPKVSGTLDYVIGRLMMKSPQARYAQWQDAVVDLHRAAKGRPVHRDAHTPPRSASTVAPYTPPPKSDMPRTSRTRMQGETNPGIRKLEEHPAPATRILLWMLLGSAVAFAAHHRWHAPATASHSLPASEQDAGPAAVSSPPRPAPSQPARGSDRSRPEPEAPRPATPAERMARPLPAAMISEVTGMLQREEIAAARERLRALAGRVGDSDTARSIALQVLDQLGDPHDLAGIQLLERYRGRMFRFTYRDREVTVIPESYAAGVAGLQVVMPDGSHRPWSLRIAELTPADRLRCLGVPPLSEPPDPVLDAVVAVLALAAHDPALMRQVLPRVPALGPFLEYALEHRPAQPDHDG